MACQPRPGRLRSQIIQPIGTSRRSWHSTQEGTHAMEASMALTGKFCFRRTLLGKVVLVVEEEKNAIWPFSERIRKRWRDASLIDLTNPELRRILELRDSYNISSDVRIFPPNRARVRQTRYIPEIGYPELTSQAAE